MRRLDSKAVLAENVRNLLVYHWGKVNITRLGREAKIGTGGAQRVLSGKEEVGPDLIDRIAHRFGLEAWMLLAPGFDPSSRPLSYAQLQSIAEQIKRATASDAP